MDIKTSIEIPGKSKIWDDHKAKKHTSCIYDFIFLSFMFKS